MHRDIKPQNLLVDPSCHILKICDFGSSKKYKEDDASVAYITSRYYRAPELIFGNTKYDYKIDIWSVGCVIAELISGEPIFKGETPHAQLVQMIKKLGTPKEDEVTAMAPDYQNKQLPRVEGYSWDDPRMFQASIHPDIYEPRFTIKPDPNAVDLVKKMLCYNPQ